MKNLIKFCFAEVSFFVKITRTQIDFYFSLIPALTLDGWGQKFHFSIAFLKLNIIRLKLTSLSLISMQLYAFKLFFSWIFMYTGVMEK